ncbi:hypothetical protein [Saccharopolyspora rectivirgula]|uniref:Uncharacterized protein n=1 Tax=Saccharopolyspora rectivirgula TaxID=28042 RepID=A0A073AU78_9PSEU|nr:hypothetical protein [Saccharopolyspora rectivirgula]KEI43348.1 hypothetical protein GU90_16450 [Saccharopolyspora rectivirgula]
MTEPASAQPNYSILLPEGFVELPGGEPTEAKLRTLAGAVATRFGLPADTEIDQGLAATAAMLMTVGASSAAGGAHYTAAAVYRSKRQPERPVMVLVNCFFMASQHSAPHIAVEGLEQYFGSRPDTTAERLRLPAGEAVVARTATTNLLQVKDSSVEITSHSITAWLPNPTGTGVLGVAVTSNNTEDWDDIVDLAQGIFQTVEWEQEELVH